MNYTALIYQSYVISFVENFALTQIDLGRCYCFVLFESVLNNAQSLHCIVFIHSFHTYLFILSSMISLGHKGSDSLKVEEAQEI